MPEDVDGDLPEDHVYFAGECTCEHDEDEHGWGWCAADDCQCEAGWEY